MVQRRMVCIVGVVASLLVVIPLFASAQDGESAILVRFKQDKTEQQIASDYRKSDDSIEKIDELNVTRIEDPTWYDRAQLAYQQVAGQVEFVEKEAEVVAFATPDDTRYSEQYALRKINASNAWNLTKGSSLLKVAVLDTGVNGTHEDLLGKVLAGYNYVSRVAIGAGTDSDDHGHGTKVSGVIAATTDNAKGVAGISWYSKILPVKVLNSSGVGSSTNLALGIRYAADQGVKVINMSLGADSGTTVVSEAVDYAYGKGVVLVAASGNEGTNLVSYPAHYDKVVAVSATGSTDLIWVASNYGPEVDICAPGVSVLTTNDAGGYSTSTGTSLAAPQVSGAAALLMSTNTGNTNAQIVSALINNADKVSGMDGRSYTERYGHGRLDAFDSFVSQGTMSAQRVAQTGSPSLYSGEVTTLWVRYRNAGTSTWYPRQVNLGLVYSNYSPNNSGFPLTYRWFYYIRPATVAGPIAPGQYGTFAFTVRNPDLPAGNYRLDVGLVTADGTWFNSTTHVGWGVSAE